MNQQRKKIRNRNIEKERSDDQFFFDCTKRMLEIAYRYQREIMNDPEFWGDTFDEWGTNEKADNLMHISQGSWVSALLKRLENGRLRIVESI